MWGPHGWFVGWVNARVGLGSVVADLESAIAFAASTAASAQW